MNVKGMIGLEIHTYLLTREKLFCKCPAERIKGQKPNSNICPICTGQPGAKPMNPNFKAVENAVKIGLMLNCKINNKFVWMRKHYSWPDLPKGYQNTLSGSYAIPIGEKGEFYGIGVSSMHLEEDPASWDPETGKVDYNRSGFPLVEIVTEPDFTNSEEVVSWLERLLHNLSYLKIVDSNAGIKVDVNVSIPGKTKRAEIKNISSLESIKNAIDYEISRQLKEGNAHQETRRFDVSSGKTIKMRSKEQAEDYRFLEDPDLVDLIIDEKMVSSLKRELPESPDVKLKKLVSKYKLDKKNAGILAKNIDLVEFYEALSEKIDPLFALPWVTVELLGQVNYHKKSLSEVNISIEDFLSLLNLVKSKKITELQAKEILREFFVKGNSFDPSKKVSSKISDEGELRSYVNKVIEKNKSAVEDYKKGEKKSFNFLMGQVMIATNKRADFSVARKILEKLLSD